MRARRIIVAHESRLLRGMLKRMIGKARQLQLAAEVEDIAVLAVVVEQTSAEWVIVSLCPDGHLPEMVEPLINGHPATHVLAISGEGDQIKLKRVGEHEQDLNVSTVEELVKVLSSYRRHKGAKPVEHVTKRETRDIMEKTPLV